MTDRSTPAPYGKVTPYLCIAGAAKALDFYKSAFGATERLRVELPNGLIAHAEIMIGNSMVMLSDVYERRLWLPLRRTTLGCRLVRRADISMCRRRSCPSKRSKS